MVIIARGLELDGRSDVYSLGCVLYEMLIGRPPLSVKQVIMQLPAPALREQNPDLPEELDAVVMKALSRKRDRRFASSGDFRDALLQLPLERVSSIKPAPQEALRRISQVTQTIVGGTLRDGRRMLLAATVAVVLVLLAVVLWLL